MSENKEEKKGFWSTLFAPKKKSSCCCASQIELIREDETPAETSQCSCNASGNTAKEIIVLGTGCASCKALYDTVKDAVTALGIDATVKKEEDLQKIMAYNVMSLPALVVDGKVVSKGKKLSFDQVKELIG